MGKVESSIGTRKFESGSGMRKYTVSDADEQFQVPPQEQRISHEDVMANRQRYIEEMGGNNGGNSGRISDPVRRRIEMLVGIGRGTREVPVGESTFLLRTLKSKEIRKTVHYATGLSVGGISTVEASYNLRDHVLSYSIYAIDGIDIDIVLNTVGMSEEEKIKARAEFLEEFDDGVINHIYSEYEKMNKENAAQFSVKTDEEAKEVSEQIKKSSEGALP